MVWRIENLADLEKTELLKNGSDKLHRMIQMNKEQSVTIVNGNRRHYSLEYRKETANMVWMHAPIGQVLEKKKQGRPPKGGS